jgi:hypothetical protein
MTGQETLHVGDLAPAETPLSRIHFVERLSDIPRTPGPRGGLCTCWWDRVTEVRGNGDSIHRACIGYQITRRDVACTLHGDWRGFFRAYEQRRTHTQCCGQELRGDPDSLGGCVCPVCDRRVPAEWLLYGDDPRGGWRPILWPLVMSDPEPTPARRPATVEPPPDDQGALW